MAFNSTLVTARCFAITPSTNAAVKFSAIGGFYVGGAGDVNVIDYGGTTTLFKAVPVGTTINQAIICVIATNTTATHLVGFGPE